MPSPAAFLSIISELKFYNHTIPTGISCQHENTPPTAKEAHTFLGIYRPNTTPAELPIITPENDFDQE